MKYGDWLDVGTEEDGFVWDNSQISWLSAAMVGKLFQQKAR